MNLSHLKPKPIPLRERASIIFLGHGKIDVSDSAFVFAGADGSKVQIPIGGLACVMLEPGTRITHAAIKLAAEVSCLLVWVGEGGVRVYASGQPGGARADRLLYQAKAALDETARLNVVREMYRLRFSEEAPSRRSVDQLRGMEGVRVRENYRELAAKHGINWQARHYDRKDWSAADTPNKALSAANACLYGLSEAAILAAGYAPAIGFLHRGLPLSFVYDIADLYKFETTVPAAFETAAKFQRGEDNSVPIDRQVRLTCRDLFRRSGLLEKIIPDIERILLASCIDPPQDAPEAAGPAMQTAANHGDPNHRD